MDRTGRLGYVPDKGLDAVFVIDLAGEAPVVIARADATAGSGPRHALFGRLADSALLHVVGELDNTVTTYRISPDGSDLVPQWRCSTLPRDALGENNIAAGIAGPSHGRFFYISNRGHDSISCLASTRAGEPVLVQSLGCLGTYPRFVRFDDDSSTLLVANENSDSIIAFDADRHTGHLSPGRVVAHTGSPVCIATRPTRMETSR